MTRVPQERRDELARMLDAATPGPWEWTTDLDVLLGGHEGEVLRHRHRELRSQYVLRVASEDAALIVAAVNALSDLLADLADAEAERDSLTEGVRAYGRTIDRWGKLIIEATGSEDITTPDGDGDWEVVEHRLSEVRAEQERLTVALRLAQARATDAADLADLRELHAPYHPFRGGSAYCRACEGNVMVTYPCPTIRALDGEADR